MHADQLHAWLVLGALSSVHLEPPDSFPSCAFVLDVYCRPTFTTQHCFFFARQFFFLLEALVSLQPLSESHIMSLVQCDLYHFLG